MSYDEHQLLPISALQHLLFCERQCALIHVEQVWADNHLTIQGQHLHKKAHGGKVEKRQGVHVTRGLGLRSLRLGLVGKADVVEIEAGRVTPIEYKRGRPKRNDSDRVQLCAQAICLEEMLVTSIPSGQIFYGQKRRRIDVQFDSRLRQLTETTAQRLHALLATRKTPVARKEPKCDSCSLIEYCMPQVVGLQRSAVTVVDKYFAANLTSTGPTTDDSLT